MQIKELKHNCKLTWELRTILKNLKTDVGECESI